MLRVEKLSIPGLPKLTFEVADGECLAVEGPSGTGKTRLLRAIADLDDVAGHVFLDGAERREMPAWQWRGLVRYAAAEPAWWTDRPREAFASDPQSMTRLVKHIADLGLPAAILDRPVAELSTGERQRLALVRALAGGPKVLLLDEPTGALDTQSAALAEELIRFQTLAGRIVLIVSHDPAQIARLADARLQLAPQAEAHIDHAPNAPHQDAPHQTGAPALPPAGENAPAKASLFSPSSTTAPLAKSAGPASVRRP
ncbi:MAG: ATP-binding cassette domain-containing protein [Hyphomicrobiaceae bacterium]|nr:ATP-binding cassette domain-containing protein [Hyphomicrobiaceae bacterium]